MSSSNICEHCASSLPRPTLADDASPGELRTALAGVKLQISMYKNLLAALDKVEEDLESRLAAVVYPISKLRFEITSSIFTHCLPNEGHVVPSSSDAPLSLSHVYANTVVPGLLETWFPRAKARPLSLIVGGLYRSHLNYVSSNMGRFRDLNIRLDYTDETLHSSNNGAFSMLSHLASVQATEEGIWNCLQNRPPLREFQILSSDLLYISLDYHSPRSTLTHLEISAHISNAMFLKLLYHFPTLSHIKCRPDIQPASVLDVDQDIAETFPNLLSLGLPSTCAALRLLKLPNLTSLELGQLAYSARLDVTAFLLRLKCRISCLRVSLAGFDENENRGETAELLSLFPSYGEKWIALLHRMSTENAEEFILTKAHFHLDTRYEGSIGFWYPSAFAQVIGRMLIDDGLDLSLRCEFGENIATWPIEDDDDSDSEGEEES
ncbi:hypothetical protein R3P38DRAFT_3444209 [Favolaschia claudopus]|uniref:Uncharacterized protein n=1 Tax=Favolaschia claudopus TaxID=2862362 RepID=A0AAV9ZQK7_9AGAR